MVSDSQATELDGTRYPVDKIWLASHGVLLGYSGDYIVREPLRVAIDAILGPVPEVTVLTRVQIEQRICEAHQRVLPILFARYVPAFPGDNPLRKLDGGLLVLGHDADGYYLFDVDGQNNVTAQNERGFHTIGSGATAAQVARAVLENYNPQGCTVEDFRCWLIEPSARASRLSRSGSALPSSCGLRLAEKTSRKRTTWNTK